MRRKSAGYLTVMLFFLELMRHPLLANIPMYARSAISTKIIVGPQILLTMIRQHTLSSALLLLSHAIQA